MNKKGQWQILFTAPILIAIGIVVLLLMFQGSVTKIINLVSSIPTVVWFIIGGLFLLFFLTGKKRR